MRSKRVCVSGTGWKLHACAPKSPSVGLEVSHRLKGMQRVGLKGVCKIVSQQSGYYPSPPRSLCGLWLGLEAYFFLRGRAWPAPFGNTSPGFK